MIPARAFPRLLRASQRASLLRPVLPSAVRIPSPASVRYASALPPRSTKYKTVTSDDVAALRSSLSHPEALLSTLDGSATADELVGFNEDWMRKYRGQSQIVIKPKSTEDVSRVVKYCHDHNIAIVPQGGNTGLVGKSFRLIPADADLRREHPDPRRSHPLALESSQRAVLRPRLWNTCR